MIIIIIIHYLEWWCPSAGCGRVTVVHLRYPLCLSLGSPKKGPRIEHARTCSAVTGHGNGPSGASSSCPVLMIRCDRTWNNNKTKSQSDRHFLCQEVILSIPFVWTMMPTTDDRPTRPGNIPFRKRGRTIHAISIHPSNPPINLHTRGRDKEFGGQVGR